MKTNRKSRRLKFIGIVLAGLLGLAGIFAVIGTVGVSENMKFAISSEEVDVRKLDLAIDELGYYAFTKETNSDFKILQLTDTHIGGGFLSIAKDRKALEAVKKLVNDIKPDLIIVTGDMVYPFHLQTGSGNNDRATKLFGTLLNSFGIPWTITYGNHDEEWYSMNSKKQLSEIYESFSNCIFQRGSGEISGQGNTFINVLNSDGTLNTALTLIDSNSYTRGGYDNIHQNQVDWYERELQSISAHYGVTGLASSLAFFHIPVNEYDDAWKLFKESSTEVIYHYGKAGEKNEKVYAPKVRSTIFDKMVELSSTKGIFCGHDHLNDFSVTYKGIRLTYGKSIDYIAYPGIKNSTWQRGGTIIEIADDASFTVTPMVLSDIQE